MICILHSERRARGNFLLTTFTLRGGMTGKRKTVFYKTLMRPFMIDFISPAASFVGVQKGMTRWRVTNKIYMAWKWLALSPWGFG